MGFFRRIGAILGFVKDEVHAIVEDDDDKVNGSVQRRPGRGFSVQVPVAAEKPTLRPIIIPCNQGEGGVQGFRWYSRRLRIDEDGDVADEFLDEILPSASSGDESRAAQPRFEVKYTTRPAPVRKQAITIDGNVHPYMEHQGMLRWV